MIAQAIVIQHNQVLMVKQYVSRGDIVWNYPGGGIELNETPEQACIREVKEETGYDINIIKLIHKEHDKYSYIAKIFGGRLFLDTENEANEDIIEVAWVDLDDTNKFDEVTYPILKAVLESSILS